LRTALVAIGVTYTLRGVLLFPQAVWFLQGQHHAVPPRQLAFSCASLVAGLAYLIGVQQLWGNLDPSSAPAIADLREP
jgi:hypothetical protein